MAADIIMRSEAKAQGLKRYYSGVPCRNGHIAERNVTTNSCLGCVAEAAVRYRKAHNEQYRKTEHDYREKNREKLRQKENERHAIPGKARDRRLARRREWRQENHYRIIEREARERAQHPENHREKSKRHYDANPERERARAKKWREENLDKRQKYLDEIGRQKSKEWRDNHREYLQEYQDEYRKKFPEKFREQYLLDRRRRRAREVGAEGNHTAAEAATILVAQNYCCKYCDADLRIVNRHLDHVMPLSRGRSNDKSNLQWLCESHNLQKSDKDPVEYERSIGFVR